MDGYVMCVDAMELVKTQRGMTEESFNEEEKKLLQWHINNLEYGCAFDLSDLSLQHW